ncbi:MAG: PD-(D/E)XK nuclease family protein, partial [Nitrospinae bacterium]|nr:PD-(D/E)XK nuclease family protein [Nitrospinota bacterium]
VPDHTEPYYAIASDQEATGSQITVMAMQETRDITTVGGNQYTDAIQKDLSVSFEQAENLKTGQGGQGMDSVTPIIDQVTETVLMEIQKTFDFFKATTSEDRIDLIVLSGGSAKVVGLKDKMTERFDTRVELFAPLVRGRKGEFRDVFDKARREGFVRVRVEGETYDLSAPTSLGRYTNHDIAVIVDRLVIREEDRDRLADSVETALRTGDGVLEVTPGGEEVARWRAWEALDPEQDAICPLEGRSQWTHQNSLNLTSAGDFLVSFRQIDDYLTCPLKYKYVNILRVPILRHHAVAYGTAIHAGVAEYNRRKAAGRPVEPDDLIRAFEGAWSSEGFLTLEHEELRLDEGRRTLQRFFADEEARGKVPTFVEKEFSFMLGTTRVVGRWDRVDETPEEAVIMDFKSSQVREQTKADKQAAKSLQLSIYAMAYRSAFGRLSDAVEFHFLESGLVGRAVKTDEELAAVEEQIDEAARGIRARRYEATPTFQACRFCAYNEVCPYTATAST